MPSTSRSLAPILIYVGHCSKLLTTFQGKCTHPVLKYMNIYRVALFILGNWITHSSRELICMRKMCRRPEVASGCKIWEPCVCVFYMLCPRCVCAREQPGTHSAARKTRLGNEFQITCLAKMGYVCDSAVDAWLWCIKSGRSDNTLGDYNCVSLRAWHFTKQEILFCVTCETV